MLPLTEIEIETLIARTNGLNAKETAAKFEVSARTIEARMDKIRAKLGAKNSMQAVYIAIKENIIK